VLDDGQVLLGNINTTQTAIYDPVANAWTGTGTKGDISSEETWTLLRDGSGLASCASLVDVASDALFEQTLCGGEPAGQHCWHGPHRPVVHDLGRPLGRQQVYGVRDR